MAFENLKKSGITYLLGKLKEHLEATYLKIANAILTVNSTGPDSYGNVQINRVNYAGDLESSFTQNSDETFLQRTTGGAASVVDGDAWLSRVMGNSVHTGFVAESLEMDVRPINEEAPISATINRDTFVSYVESSGTITLTFTTSWSADPTNYGITVTGTPSAGDQIVIVYVKEEPGTITTANPSSFVSTGWNLYQSANGYAKVVRYSDAYGYKISGDYTALQFSTTVNGEKSPLTAEDGMFNVEQDGYVWVTGGNAANTAIWPTWSDWTDNYAGSFMAFSSSEIDLSDVMSTYFPYGLCKVGNAYDEINISLGVAIVRIDVLENNSTNMATAKSSGRLFEYDENYIYIVKATASTNSIDVSGAYSANQHGIEYFTGTSVETEAQTIYGMNLKNKLERDTLTISQQTLSENEKKQVLGNIGGVGFIPQSLTSAQKEQARNNIGALSSGAVKNNHSTTESGYVLDARQGKSLYDICQERVVGKRQTKEIAGGANSCRIDFNNGEIVFMILSMPGPTRTWVGTAYTGSNGDVTVEQLNSNTAISVTGYNKYVEVTFNYSSTGYMHMTAIPFRGSGVPVFH